MMSVLKLQEARRITFNVDAKENKENELINIITVAVSNYYQLHCVHTSSKIILYNEKNIY